MLVKPPLRELDFEEAMAEFDEGAALIDFRPVDDYLDVHVPGSISLLFEAGPGMASRARDCLPLNVPLVLIDLGGVDIAYAAAALRGKGFHVVGSLPDAINAWVGSGGKPGSTDVVAQQVPPQGLLLDVADPGARPPDEAKRIPLEHLWGRADDFADEPRVVISAGKGVRAAMAVGMLERAGVGEILFWKRAGTPGRRVRRRRRHQS
jgi:rhodanese-related sulfurtransferase